MKTFVYRWGGIGLGLVLLLGGAAPVFGQNEENTQQSNSENQPTPQVDLDEVENQLNVQEGKQATCSDYYTFGSVKLDMSTDRVEYSAGDPVIIEGTVTNTNSYPLMDVDVVARVFKEYSNPTENGNTLLVDEFTLTENLTLEADKTQKISGGYTLSQNRSGGEYTINLYTTDQDRFAMSGVVFSESVYGQQLTFNVKSDQKKEGVYIDRGRVQVNGKSYNTSGQLTRHSSDKPVTVTFPLVNDSKEQKTVELDYNLYRWSTQREANNLQYKTEQVMLQPGQSKELAYTVSEPSEPVYLMDIVASVDENKVSETQVRFGIQNDGRPRIKAAGITGMPATKDEQMFVCVHNMNRGTTPVNMTARLTDTSNETSIANIAMDGTISGRPQGLVDTIQTDTPVTKAQMNITLKSAGKTVDTMQIRYACSDLEGVSCETQGFSLNKSIVWILGLSLGVGLLGASIGFGWWYVRKSNKI